MFKFINYLKYIRIFFDRKTATKIAQFLIENKMSIAVAESCTGGLISSMLTDVSGSSAFINANFVTYANEAKTKYLGVDECILQKHGAVSVQTADAMVKGLLNIEVGGKLPDCAIATTGIAGPTGGSVEKPVGLVYIGLANKNSVKVEKYVVNSSYPRFLIKYLFAQKALKLFLDFIRNNDEVDKL